MTPPLVDAHVHVMPARVREQMNLIAAADPWFAACHAGKRVVAGEDELLRYMDQEAVTRAVVFSWPFRDPRLCAEANDFIAGLQQRHPDRVHGCGIIQPADPEAAAELHRCAGLGLAGIGELNADAQGFALEDAVLPRLAEISVELGLPWTLHCSEPVGHRYPGKGTATPDRLVTLVERSGGLRLVAAHLGGGLPFFAHMPEIAELCRTIWFDTAALPYLYRPSAVTDVVALVGADRVLLGTDFPLLGMDRYRQALDMAGLDGDQRQAISGGNASQVWNSAR